MKRSVTGLFGIAAILLTCLERPLFSQTREKIKILQTSGRSRFGLLGSQGEKPAPTLFILASSLEEALGNDDYAKVGKLLIKKGFVCVSLDLPCHGKDRQGSEPAGLGGWRARLEKGEGFVSPFNKKLSAVLDYLIDKNITDAKRVAVCGTSRGGFMALHAAAAEPRLRCVAAFAPVTDLLALREFAGMEKNAKTRDLDLRQHAGKLAGRSVWLCIGNNDQRVGTDQAIAFTRKVVASFLTKKLPPDVQLHVMDTIGHSIHATAHEEAALWIAMRLGK
jgi:dienelactone hydrolase